MADVMRGSPVSAPPPMHVTFAEDYPGRGIRLVDTAWPARLLVTRYLLDLARRAETTCLTYDGHELRFDLLNATATYRQIGPYPGDGSWIRDAYVFECVQSSRDLTDA